MIVLLLNLPSGRAGISTGEDGSIVNDLGGGGGFAAAVVSFCRGVDKLKNVAGNAAA